MNVKMLLAATSLLLSFNAYAEKEHHHDFAPDVAAFHEVLAPLWHATPGKKRQEDVCIAMPKMTALSQKIQHKNVPQLQQSLSLLQKNCSSSQDVFDSAFGKVHDAFHKVAEH